MNVITKWEATEFRLFLLYYRPVVLKDILSKDLYNHFLLLHVACRILSLKDFCISHNGHAKLYLIAFVELAKKYYGITSQVLNMHSLIYIADDVMNINCSISEITSFPFENYLGKIKKYVRSGNKPLVQVCNRLTETWNFDKQKVTLPAVVEIISKKKTK